MAEKVEPENLKIEKIARRYRATFFCPPISINGPKVDCTIWGDSEEETKGKVEKFMRSFLTT